MKVSIKNLLGLQRNLSKPNGVTFSIDPYERIQLVDKDKHEEFYLGYNKHQCIVRTQLEEVHEEVVEEQVVAQATTETVNVEPPKEDIITETPNETTLTETPQEEVPPVEEKVETVEITKESTVELLNSLTVDELKAIASNLNIATSSNKAATLINKIVEADLVEVNNAVATIKGDA